MLLICCLNIYISYGSGHKIYIYKYDMVYNNGNIPVEMKITKILCIW